MVRKEIWAHVLAYNLIRAIIAQAANEFEIEPRTISFKSTVQTIKAFQPVLAMKGDHDATYRRQLNDNLLAAIATHRVGDRPDRIEPRKKKLPRRRYDFLAMPRSEAKRQIMKGLAR